MASMVPIDSKPFIIISFCPRMCSHNAIIPFGYNGFMSCSFAEILKSQGNSPLVSWARQKTLRQHIK